MIYVEWLRARKRLAIFAAALALIVIVLVAIGYFGHVAHVSTNGDVSVGVTVGSGDGHAPLLRDMVHQALQKVAAPLGAFFVIAAFATTLFTTLLYTSLHAQRTSLDLAFTKPLSRLRLASTFFAIDFGAIVACYAIAVLLALLPMAAFGALDRIVGDPSDPLVIALGLGICVLLYGLMQLATAWLRGGGAIAIISAMWITFIAVVSFEHVHVTNIDAVLRVLRKLDPLYYFGLLTYSDSGAHPVHLGPSALLVWILGCVACALAAYAWQRVEL